MPNDYFVRITHSYEVIAKLVSLWALRADKLVVYEHTGTKTEKVHCHILILGSVLQKKQLRNIGQQFVDLKGNENCSFKECVSWDTPVVYMTKGNLDAKYLKGFSKEDADKWKSKWVPPAVHQKKNPYEGLYNYVFGDPDDPEDAQAFRLTKDDATAEDFGFRRMARHVRAWVFAYNNNFWTPQAHNQYKVCVYTYAMRYKLPIPNNEWSKWL